MMIQKDVDYFDNINGRKIQELRKLAAPILTKRQKMLNRYAPSDFTDKVPFEFYIVNMMRGYLSGKPPSYSVPDDELSEILTNIQKYNDDAAVFSDLMEDFLVKAAAYLYVTENEANEIVYTPIDPLSAVCVYDYNIPPYPVAFVRFIKDKVEITTAASKRMFDLRGKALEFDDYVGGVLQKVREKQLAWGDVPVIAFEDRLGLASFEPVIGLIDTFTKLLGNIKSMTQYNDDAKLIFKGYENPVQPYTIDPETEEYVKNPDWEKNLKAFLESRVIPLDENGEMSWLIKTIDYTGLLGILEFIHRRIVMITAVPDMTEAGFAQARSGEAIGFTLYPLDQRCASIEKIFKRGYLRLFEIITNRINIHNNSSHDFRTIQVNFIRNVPADKDQTLDRAIKAKNEKLISNETAIQLSGLAVDAACEMEAIKNDGIDIAKLIELFRAEAIDKRNLLSQIFPPDTVVNILSNFEDTETQRGIQEEDYFNEYHRNKQQSNRARTAG